MPITALKLITEAYYLAGITSREIETVSQPQISDGLNALNDILAVMRVDIDHIPYYDQIEFNTVSGQEMYHVANLVSIETLTFNLNTVRFSTYKNSRDKYFGSSRSDILQTLPFGFFAERKLNGMNIYFYPIPNAAYPIKVNGKIWMNNVELMTNLSALFDDFYCVYLKYKICDYLCQMYNQSVPPLVARELVKLEELTRDISPKDLTIQRASPFNCQAGVNWAMVNLCKGTIP